MPIVEPGCGPRVGTAADSETAAVDELVGGYLREQLQATRGWTVGRGPGVLAGRGVVAARDYGEGDVIFVDAPLIVSPRVLRGGGDGCGPVCPVCYAPVTVQQHACPGGCRLPVCGQRCAGQSGHADECRYVRRLCPDETADDDNDNNGGGGGRRRRRQRPWSAGVYNAVTAIRGLAVKGGPHAFFLDVLQQKSTDRPAFEVEELKRNVSVKLEEEDERIMTVTCRIMDANCFETITNRNGSLVSLKGLYPVASFMNHSCVPNTMHNFDEKLRMIVKASRPIYKGQEITTTYTHSIWPTPLRQNHLLASKQFLCTCRRCCDPEEFGTGLAALNCIVGNCDGRILPVNPLDKTSVWQCKACPKLVTSVEVTALYENIKSLTNGANALCPKRLETVLNTFNIHKNSAFVIDLRLKFIWKTKNNGLSLEELLYKEKSCVEMLNIVHKLGLGQCRLLGLLSLELSKVIGEKVCRFHWKPKTLDIFKDQMNKLNKVAASVLKGDANTSIPINNNDY